ncbi:MAG: PLP-dependent transferase [Enterobacteriaceae bacterium]
MKTTTSIETLAVHAGDQRDPGHNAIFPPIVTASSFIHPNLGEGGEFSYSRCANPTRSAYESALAELEGGIYATATASGVAATSLVLELLPRDSHIIVMSGVYGGTYRLFERVKRYTSDMSFSYIDLNDMDALNSAVMPNSRSYVGT